MSGNIKLDFSGLKELQREFERLQQKHIAEGYSQASKKEFWLKEIRKYLLKEIKNIFNKQGIGRGGKWPNLRPEYARRKGSLRTSRSSKKLRLTDAYYDAATGGPTLQRKPGQILLATEDALTLGIDPDYFADNFGAPYPLYHETGTTKMPKRPVYAQLSQIKNLEQELAERAESFFILKGREAFFQNRFR